jgi:cob(I)alamin adenosyltransferase
MKIYTKTGDTGDTSLLGGARVGKDDLRVEAYGAVDELNALLGVALSHADDADLRTLLATIQKDLFAIGSQLADPVGTVVQRQEKAVIADAHVEALEHAIDGREAALPPLRTFILPGGGTVGATLHLARTVCRRAERRVVALGRASRIAPVVVVYLNRLSDLLFVLAREANVREGRVEDPW